jgi:hypothetical protein
MVGYSSDSDLSSYKPESKYQYCPDSQPETALEQSEAFETFTESDQSKCKKHRLLLAAISAADMAIVRSPNPKALKVKRNADSGDDTKQRFTKTSKASGLGRLWQVLILLAWN